MRARESNPRRISTAPWPSPRGRSLANEYRRGDVRRPAMALDQLVTNSERNRLCSVMNLELGQDVLDVLAHGLRAYEELLRHLRLAKPLDEEGEDVEFPPRQLARLPSSCERRREEPSHACEQLVGIERFHEVVVAADLVAGHSRQEHLDDDKRGPPPLGRSERLLARLSLVGGVADPLEHA